MKNSNHLVHTVRTRLMEMLDTFKGDRWIAIGETDYEEAHEHGFYLFDLKRSSELLVDMELILDCEVAEEFIYQVRGENCTFLKYRK